MTTATKTQTPDLALRLRIVPGDGGEIFETTLGEFVEANAEDEETVERVSALTPGSSTVVGGGAGCEMIVEALS